MNVCRCCSEMKQKEHILSIIWHNGWFCLTGVKTRKCFVLCRFLWLFFVKTIIIIVYKNVLTAIVISLVRHNEHNGKKNVLVHTLNQQRKTFICYLLSFRAGTIQSAPDSLRIRYDTHEHDFRFQQQSKCFGLIHTVNTTNTSDKAKWLVCTKVY